MIMNVVHVIKEIRDLKLRVDKVMYGGGGNKDRGGREIVLRWIKEQAAVAITGNDPGGAEWEEVTCK